VVAGPPHDLLESLAGAIAASRAGRRPGQPSVTVAVRKLRPPVPHDVVSTGVRLTRVHPAPTLTGPGPRALTCGPSSASDRTWVTARDHLRQAVSEPFPTWWGVPGVRDGAGGGSGGPGRLPEHGGRARHAMTPRELLALAHGLEETAGRVRTVRNGPRTLDVDVLLVGDLVIDEPDLVVPHPRMWERRFVVEPLGDLAPDLVGTFGEHCLWWRGPSAG
jgi:hypothetical protein